MNEAQFNISLKEATDLLRACDVLKEPNVGKNKKSINRDITDLTSYKNCLNGILDNFAYDLLLDDDSIFQFDRYEVNKEVVYRYVFMQNPLSRKISYEEFCTKNNLSTAEMDDFREYYEDDSSPDTITEINFPLYLRFDVNKLGYKPALHSYAHLHIGVYEDLRIAARRLITPAAFVAFVIKMIYPQKWESLQNQECKYSRYNFKKNCQEINTAYWDSIEEYYIHLD